MLNLALRDLPLINVEKTLARDRELLAQELRRCGVNFDFHLWVSDEWFCPDGVPGIALPFYLFHPQLIKLEKEQIGFVEGSTERQRLKLLRHELGHCIDNAFCLRKNRKRQELFGSSKKPYPESYSPKKYSQNYVHYLGDNYAQSHPDEDFAETFAVWLDESIDWKNRYKNTAAYDKLLLMDQMMKGLRGKTPFLKNKYRIDPIEKQRRTLRDYFTEKKSRLRVTYPHLDHHFKSLFDNEGPISLAYFLRRERHKIERKVAENVGVYRYQVRFVVNRAIRRAQEIKVYGTKEQLLRKTPLLIEKNFRYLREKQQLKFYL